jgi:hypothetical protein
MPPRVTTEPSGAAKTNCAAWLDSNVCSDVTATARVSATRELLRNSEEAPPSVRASNCAILGVPKIVGGWVRVATAQRNRLREREMRPVVVRVGMEATEEAGRLSPKAAPWNAAFRVREKARTVPIRGGIVADRDRPAGRVPDAFCRSFMAVLRSGPNFPGHVGPSAS